MKTSLFFALSIVSSAGYAQITNYTDQYGRPVGAAIQQGNVTFYTDGQGRPIGSAIGGQPTTPPQFQQQQQIPQPQSQGYTDSPYAPNRPSRYTPDSYRSIE
ncbi:MAG: hypothetical protein RIQ55_989 [Pseudomonadota bacterium]|jgi:hypothetical protein